MIRIFFKSAILGLCVVIFIGNSVRLIFSETFITLTNNIGNISDFPQNTRHQLRRASVRNFYESTLNFQLKDVNGFPVSITLSEQSHMNDVKKLSKTFFFFHKLAVVTFLGYLGIQLQQKKYGQLNILSVKTFKVITGLIVIGIINILFFWDRFFTLFHQVFFPQGNWSFPENSLIIQLFPEQFWIAATISVIVLTWMQAFIIRTFALELKKVYVIPSDNEGSVGSTI